jgi:hypothetical protein
MDAFMSGVSLIGPTERYTVVRGPNKFQLLSYVIQPYAHKRLRTVTVKIRSEKDGREVSCSGRVMAYAPTTVRNRRSDHLVDFVVRVSDPSPCKNFLVVIGYDMSERSGSSARFMTRHPGYETNGQYSRRWSVMENLEPVRVRKGVGPWEAMNSLGNPLNQDDTSRIWDRLSLNLFMRFQGQVQSVVLRDEITGKTAQAFPTMHMTVARCDHGYVCGDLVLRLELQDEVSSSYFHAEFNTKTGSCWIRAGHGWDPKNPFG